jgi:hypothetical protein
MLLRVAQQAASPARCAATALATAADSSIAEARRTKCTTDARLYAACVPATSYPRCPWSRTPRFAAVVGPLYCTHTVPSRTTVSLAVPPPLPRWPGLFSRGLVGHAGPTQQQMEATVTTFDLFAAGYSSPPPPGVAAGKPDKHVSADIMPVKQGKGMYCASSLDTMPGPHATRQISSRLLQPLQHESGHCWASLAAA